MEGIRDVATRQGKVQPTSCSGRRKAKAASLSIVHPVLKEAYDADWYYPFHLTDEHLKIAGVRKAIQEGWSEWIETPDDIEAIKAGYVYDLSRDHQKRIIYWFHGRWVRYHRNSLVEIDEDQVAHVGAGDHAVRFAELFLLHTKDPLKGEPYRFIHWQRKVVQTLFGWVKYTKDTRDNTVHYRRFLEAMVEVAKKNAKSDLSSVISTILLRADHTNKAFIYGAASDRNQARIIYNESRDYVKFSPYLSQEVEIVDSKGKMIHWETGSTYEVVSADAYRNDGYDAHGILFDELHQQPNRQLFAILKRAGLARPQPLRFVTTTYGKSLLINTGKMTAGNIWAEEHLKSKSQLEGRRVNIRRLSMIASAEPIPVVVTQPANRGDTRLSVWRLQQPVAAGEEFELTLAEAVSGIRSIRVRLSQAAKRYQWHLDVEPLGINVPANSEGVVNENPLAPDRIDHAIRRANPSVGVTIALDRVKEEILDAVGPIALAEAMQYCLNIVSGGGAKWLTGAAWIACGRRRVLPSATVGQRCFGGLDLSLIYDLTSFWLAFPNWKAGKSYTKAESPLIRLVGMVWVPEADIERREEMEEIPYRAYSQMKNFAGFGYVRICPGEVIDYTMVGNDILTMLEDVRCQAVAYDPNYAQFVVDPILRRGGVRCIGHRQGAISMGPPTKRFENIVKRGHLIHGNHPLLNMAVDGAVLKTPDSAGNTFPCKTKSMSRIDPLVAAVMAAGFACDPPQEARGSGAWSGEVGSGLYDEQN